MEFFACTPHLLKKKGFLRSCGMIFAEKHPETSDYITGTVNFGDSLLLYIIDSSKKIHVNRSIKAMFNEHLMRPEIILETIWCVIRDDIPEFDLKRIKIDTIKRPEFEIFEKIRSKL